MDKNKFKRYWVCEVNNWICDAAYSGKELKARNPIPSFRKFWYIRAEADLLGFTQRKELTNKELVEILLKPRTEK